MTPEQQHMTIAKACGWGIKRRDITGFNVWEPDAKLPAQLSNNLENKLPNYTGDLNAMHEAEKTLSFSQETKYVANLMKQHKEYPMTTGFLATAAQRAEAFLRTIGKWKEVRNDS